MAKKKTLPKHFDLLAQTGTLEDLKKVFEQCDINAYGGYYKSNALSFPLSYDMMEWLIEQGADINYVDKYGYTPLLHLAGQKTTEEQAINLIKLGADIHYTYKLYKDNALHRAIPTGNLKLVQCLVEAGIDTAARNWHDDTPLESAFRGARTFDLINLEPVTKYLLSTGIPVTEKLQTHLLDIAKDIEFRRKDLNPESLPELDAALDSLYALLNVEPVPRRVEFDGKSPITVKATTWQKQHQELWDLLVPGSGHASTVQGEVIRITGRVSYEILDNGGINWDADYNEMCKTFLAFVQTGTPLPEEDVNELTAIVRTIKSADEKECARMTELAVKWVLLNLTPIAIGEVNYRR